MDVNTLRLNSINLVPQPKSILQPPRAQSTSPQIRQEYKRKGNCLRCGSDNHWVQDCFFRPHSPGAQAKINALQPLKSGGQMTIAAIDDSAYDECPEWEEEDIWEERHITRQELKDRRLN